MHYTLHLTNRCNLRCDYCYVGHGENDMSDETARAAVDLARRGVKRAGIIFFGGEPLLRRELIHNTVAYARTREKENGCQYFFKITTNGLLLDDDFLAFAQREDIFVALSLDGLKGAHDAHRRDAQGNGCYGQAVDAAHRLLKVRPYSPALMTVRPDTLSQYAAGVESLFELGFSYVIASMDYAADWQDGDLSELRRQYELLADLYERKTLAEEKFYFSPFEVKISSHINNRTYCHERCELGLRQLSVGPDGMLYPCVQFVGDPEFALGDVRRGIDETVRQALYTRNEQEKPGCDRCAIRTRCNHYCACLNRQATGSIDEISPVLCAHERIVLPIADRLAERLYKKGSALFIQKQYNDFYPLVSLMEDREEVTCSQIREKDAES